MQSKTITYNYMRVKYMRYKVAMIQIALKTQEKTNRTCKIYKYKTMLLLLLSLNSVGVSCSLHELFVFSKSIEYRKENLSNNKNYREKKNVLYAKRYATYNHFTMLI